MTEITWFRHGRFRRLATSQDTIGWRKFVKGMILKEVVAKMPDVVSWTSRFQYSHCSWVTSRSFVTSVRLNAGGNNWPPCSVWESFWITTTSFEIIPSINLLHPIVSCDVARRQKRPCLKRVISVIFVPPLPRAHRMSICLSSGFSRLLKARC